MSNTRYQMVQGAIRRRYSRPRRSPNEMMLDMLRACFAEPTTISAVMLKANISWKEVMKFSVILTTKGLLTHYKLGHSRTFHVTPDGKQAVFLWNKLRDILQT